ncbi:MAG: CarD family transcriptional regulator [Alphaproteobacteria bacterium]|nr:CarD family transcriptional regulator [Alphaproteobacteria bacterium]
MTKKKVTKKKPAASKKKAPATKKVTKTAKKAPASKAGKAAGSTKKTKTAAAAKKTSSTKKAAVKTKTAAKAAPKKATKAKQAAKPKKTKAATATPVVKKTGATAVQATVKGKTAVKVSPPAKKKAVAQKPEAQKIPEKLDFAAGDYVVYPAHGVGLVEGVETQTIAGMNVTLYTICFDKDRMRLKLPVSKVKSSGLRKLSSRDRLKDALSTLQGRAQVRRIMWSRRAQEYEAKINSGDPVSIAEVLRDLRKNADQSEQSYSERQIYQAALERLAREVAAIEKIDEKKAAEKLEAVLSNVAAA